MKKVFYVIVILVLISFFYPDKDNEKDIKNKATNANTIYEVVVEIDYKKKSFSYNDKATIYVDDKKIGSIKADEHKKYKFNTTGGEHKIWVEGGTSIRENKSSKLTFEVDDKNCYFPYKLKDGSIAGLSLSVDYSKK